MKLNNPRESSGRNPLETSMKSSQNFKPAAATVKHTTDKLNSLIKEDSNEEKSSSNSNSNNDLAVVPSMKP